MKPVKTSSEDSDVIKFNNSSEYSSEAEESDFFNEGTSNRCAECGKRFVRIEQRRAIGCDTEYCR